MLLLLGLAVRSSGVSTVYVNADTVQLRDDKGISATVVANAQRGAALDVLRQDARWYYVATSQGTQGWVYRFKVSDQPPVSGSDLFAALGQASGNIAIHEASSASGVRGVNPLAARQHDRQRSVKALQVMEQFQVSPEALESFLRRGRLGEYQ
jgi:uncharacterized protein YgiM (DUF1202 family)